MSTATRAMPQASVQVDEGASTVILLYLLLLSITGSIAAANWSDDLGVLTFAIAISATLSMLLAKIKRVPGAIAHPLMLVLSVPATAILGALTLPGTLTIPEKLIVLVERIIVWVRQVSAGGSSSDNFIFVLQLCLVVWLVGHLSAWFVFRRRQVWGAIIPTGLVIVINLFYAAPQAGLYIGLYLLSAMLLLVRMNLQSMELKWRSSDVGYSSDISFDFLYNGALLVMILLFAIWLVPATAPDSTWFGFLDPLEGPWKNVEEQFTRMFSALRGTRASSFTGATLSIGGPIHLTQDPVMDIQAEYPRYWRATVYDKYTGIGWISTHLTAQNLTPNDSRLETFEYYRVEVTQTIKLYTIDQNILYAQSEPVRFGIPTEVRHGKPPASENNPFLFDVTTIRARQNLREGTTYTAVSAISIADAESLRHAPINYTDWITATYLQLPAELPARVRSLAQTITISDTNPYDKAKSLENYLRNHITYNESVTAPPTGQDGVDYTLFDRPEGYCNYYASAMAVMARTLGIPARVVSGFAMGKYENGVYHIVEANSHAWVEIYFPGYGWIEFEPTASKPVIERPDKYATSAPSNLDLQAEAEARRRQQRDKEAELENQDVGRATLPFDFSNSQNVIVALTGGIIGLGVLSVLTIGFVRAKRRAPRLAPAARAYEQMVSRARWLGIREQKFATPLERAQIIGGAVPNAQSETDYIASVYTRERFGAQKLDADEIKTLGQARDKWNGEWKRKVIESTIQRVVTPPRNFIANVRRAVEHWGGNFPE